jgi:solute:Na+ symporter, SSS family
MSFIDWIVLCVTLFCIIIYGVWKSRNSKNIDSFLLADRQLPWYHVGLSVMATQASAITFLSAPGQAYADGMRFVQFYFGLPLAMIVLCITFVPRFHSLNVYTAYEFLEKRFDNKTRTFTAFLFLLQRGLSTGITIYAPAIVLSTILHIDITYTILINGILVISYTVYGGAKAVSYTQVWQMAVIFGGLFLAAYLVVHLLPTDVGLSEALNLADTMNKLNTIDTHFDWNNKYNIWSGIIGGFFLQLSYFGTDQSQVGRYLTGSSIKQSRMGLIMNGIIKIPMQFFILLIGVLVFVFYQYNAPPLFFNKVEDLRMESSLYKTQYDSLKTEHQLVFAHKQKQLIDLNMAVKENKEAAIASLRKDLQHSEQQTIEIKKQATKLIQQNNAKADTNDSNYVFLVFVTEHLPKGVVGLLIAVIFLASMGSTASGLNSLASTTVVDFYKRLFHKNNTDKNYLNASRWATVAWGVFCIIVALYARKLGNLIEAVNILGSLFYGTILGIFLCAFYLKKVQSAAVFTAAIIAEVFVIACWWTNVTSFLWLNVIGCLLLMLVALIVQVLLPKQNTNSLSA